MSEWIKCSERMPKLEENGIGDLASDKVLISDGDAIYKGRYRKARTCAYWSICPDCESTKGLIPIITHWMEVPEIE